MIVECGGKGMATNNIIIPAYIYNKQYFEKSQMDSGSAIAIDAPGIL